MTVNAFQAEVSAEERDRCLAHQPAYQGNADHLALFTRVRDTPIRSSERREALTGWAAYNTTVVDWVESDVTAKGPFRKVQSGLDLRGMVLDASIIGPVDLRGTDLRDTDLAGCSFSKADFTDADLRGANLERCCLRGVNLANARLEGANLSGALLADANLRGAEGDDRTRFDDADLQGANLSMGRFQGSSFAGANLQLAQVLETDLRGADLSGCKVFGIAAWSPKLDADTRQSNLLVTPEQSDALGRGRRQNAVEVQEPVLPMTTDSLEHAHLVHLMMNPDLSDLLESVTSKGVLLLGRFSGEFGETLDRLRKALRAEGFLPLKFDFRRPEDRTLKETVLTLAGLSRFVVADLTEASSIPLELTTIVKDYKIPIVPIHRKGHRTFSMFKSIEQEYRDRVLPPLEYTDVDDLIGVLKPAIIEPALERAAELVTAKGIVTPSRSTASYRQGDSDE